MIDEKKLIEDIKRNKLLVREAATCRCIEYINNQPQVQPIDADYIIKQIEEQTSFIKDCTKYGNKDLGQQHKSYSTMMMYEVADLVDNLIEIIRQSGKKVP